MKKAKVLAYCLFAFSFAGEVRKVPRAAGAQILHSTVSAPGGAASLQLANRQGADLFRQARYAEASQIFRTVFQTARSRSSPDIAGRALGNLAGCQFALHNYRGALRSYLEAQRLSLAANDRSTAAIWNADIASLYSEMGEYDAAAQWIEHSISDLSAADRTRQLPKLQIQMAIARAGQGRMADAAVLFHNGIDGAERAGNRELYLIACNRLGEARLQAGDLSGAEAPLLEAYRARKLGRLPLDTSYRSLGRLRLEQGDLASASVLLDRAVELAAHPKGLAPTWDIYHSRGLVRRAQKRLPEALEDLRVALRLGRAWRWEILAGDAAQVGAEGLLDDVYSAFVDTGNLLYLKTRNPRLVGETFATNEENRAVSLRAAANAPTADLPDAYWEALNRLQRAEVTALRGQGSGLLAEARAEVVRLEASAGGAPASVPEDLTDAVRSILSPGTVLFSFRLGRERSWLWALDRAGLDVYPLPSRAEFEAQVEAVTGAIREGRPEAARLSARLYRTMFGRMARNFRNEPNWLLALDGPLYSVPIAALVENGAYVVERHAVTLIPGAAWWLDSGYRPAEHLAPLFVGLGDPIYNRADARFTPAAFPNEPILSLPRLPGSGTEIDASAAAWPGPSLLLRGPHASRQDLMRELGRHPAAVHLAAHYLESAGPLRQGLIALSLSFGSQAELLMPTEIAGWRIHAGLIVLSGCGSGNAVAQPGEGLMGLTRAWLAAGANAVMASLWDTPDDSGALFRPLYRNLRSGNRINAPHALRLAQLEMIHSGGILSRPAYWGAYFIMASRGREVVE